MRPLTPLSVAYAVQGQAQYGVLWFRSRRDDMALNWSTSTSSPARDDRDMVLGAVHRKVLKGQVASRRHQTRYIHLIK